MQASMVAAGPNLKNMKDVQVIQQVDIYPMICAILGLDHPNRIDGDLKRVAQFITPRPSDDFINTFMQYAKGGSTRLDAIGIIVYAALNILFLFNLI